MNRRLFFRVLIMALIFLALPSLCSSSAENLLRNADFRELNGDGLPADWYIDAYIQETGYSVFQVSEGDRNHPLAVSVRNIGDNDARFAQTVKVEPDSMYLFSGYICAEEVEGGHGANLSVEGIYAFSRELYDTAGEWQYIEYYGETGPDQEYVTVFARLGGYSGVCTGSARFADLSLVKVDRVPDDVVPDLWYKMPAYAEEDTDGEYPGEVSPGSFRVYLFLIGIIYTIAACVVLFRRRAVRQSGPETGTVRKRYIAALFLASLALRMMISCLVEGYMVDVNCFLSWGHTMAAVGPAGFYEATSFCDYPPLYTYILGLNSWISGLLGGGSAVSRVVFRFIPSLADLAGCWLLYRLLLRQGHLNAFSGFLFLLFAAFNPAAILNSAAWGQMDSVLCLLLTAVALYAIKGEWKAALPVYVAAVLVKPQALMLGPLGLLYIVMTFIRDRDSRRSILSGTAISIAVLLAGVIPFSIRQDWDWIIQLYSRTLASYPYATVNTANLYYLFGGNWSAVGKNAHIIIPILFSLFCASYGCWWYRKAKIQPHRTAETVISILFSFAFIVCACLGLSWTWNGVLAMVFAFVIVLSHAIRSGKIIMMPWFGGLLFILLYVFGIKMHERYVFPAFLLLSAAWVILRDRRILYLILLYSLTVFLNEGIVLDNSILLGSSMGHLNSDTVLAADMISILNVSGALYAVWLSADLLYPREQPLAAPVRGADSEWQRDSKLHWNRKDTVLVTLITLAYSAVSLLTLGSTKAPQTCWTSSSPEEEIVFDLGQYRQDFEILYFAQVSRNDFLISVSEDAEHWEEDTWAQMDQGQCWKWKYVTESYLNDKGQRTYFNSDNSHIVRFSGRYVKLTADQLGLRLNELLFRESSGSLISAEIKKRTGAEPESELYSDPSALLDEQQEMEGLPSFPAGYESDPSAVQPSWWNSTYFDEIYHARTAYEFLHGTVPYETSHPPLGKVLMSISVAVFGMTPFGWRFAGALAGILMIPGMYLTGKQLTKKTSAAVLCCLFMTFDCMHLTQTQIATIDSFPVLFIIFAYFFMLRFLQSDYIRDGLQPSLSALAFSGMFMGLSIASKWIGIYAGAGLAVLFFWHCFRLIRYHQADAGIKDAYDGIRNTDTPLKKTLAVCAFCILFFVVVPVSVYLLSYIPYMAYNAGRIQSLWDYVDKVWQAQVGMFNYHSTPNLGMDHPFYSPWWEWPVIGKPMYYASQQYLPADNPVHHSIFCFGNPVIWFGGLAAIAVCVIRALLSRRYRIGDGDVVWHLKSISRDPRYAFILVGILAQYLPWVLVPRGTYIYHYFASLPFLMCAAALSFHGYRPKFRKADMAAAVLFTIAAAVFFIILFPYASGMNVSSGWLNIGRRILRIWY